ncbi:hypothetical protein EI94DRAFT_1736999 [Lactarius quietus]|nr:hypothetical protein EI94DRAFT_1736999 [Lactarius quietus]
MATSPSNSTVSPDITRFAAPLLFGLLINWALYGALCVQVYVYSYNFSNDKLSLKLLTYFLFALETVQTALTGADLYFWFVTGFGDVERIRDSHYASIDVPLMTAISSFLVQGYFCYRIWMLNRRLLWFCCIIAIFTLTQSTAAVWAAITSLTSKQFAVSRGAVYAWSIASAMADMLIAAAMTMLLRNPNGGFSNLVLIRVVQLTIETNALTASVAVTSLILYAAFPNEVYYALLIDFIGKLYTNTFLVSLNNRIYLRDRLPPGYRDTARSTVSDRVRATIVTPPRSSGPEQRSRASTSDAFPLYDISREPQLEKGYGDATDRKLPVSVFSP